MSLDMLPEDNRRQKQLQLRENYESFQLMVDQDLNKQYMHNVLQLNNGDSSFSEIALCGCFRYRPGWGALFADFDNDRYKDLFVTNGFCRITPIKIFCAIRNYKIKGYGQGRYNLWTHYGACYKAD